MALVVLLRGVNVGGSAGTFVVRQPVSRAQLRLEVARRLPFDAEIMICQGREIVRLMSRDFFSRHPARPEVVRIVSVLSRSPQSAPRLPMKLPTSGKWLVKVLGRDGRFVFGLYRRHMKVISYMGTLDRLFGVPVTTRNWNTMVAIAKAKMPSATAAPRIGLCRPRLNP